MRPHRTHTHPHEPEDRQHSSAPATERTTEDLHVCPYCAGAFVYPLDWSEEGPWHWRIVLRCPDCERVGTGVFPQAIVERFDNELERASGELLTDLRRLTHANMAEEIQFFVKALDADVVVPSDF
jgi:hypothetical protein